jgi:hypothetical protein
MITIEKFETIRNKYGNYASWALWVKQTDKPKSNIGDMRIFDQDFNPNLLNSINTDVVMVGLNISRSFSEHFKNFHDDYPRANDFKIRYAFEGEFRNSGDIVLIFDGFGAFTDYRGWTD